MPLGRSQVVFSQFENLILDTLCRARQITNHVVNRSVRRAQLLQFARRSWSKADRRHARERNAPIFGWQQLLPVEDELAHKIDSEAGEERGASTSQAVFVIVTIRIPGFACYDREAWYPDRYNYKDGLRSGSTSLLTGFGINLVREFVFNW